MIIVSQSSKQRFKVTECGKSLDLLNEYFIAQFFGTAVDFPQAFSKVPCPALRSDHEEVSCTTAACGVFRLPKRPITRPSWIGGQFRSSGWLDSYQHGAVRGYRRRWRQSGHCNNWFSARNRLWGFRREQWRRGH